VGPVWSKLQELAIRFVRSSGILLHPTSLLGRWGIGDLGAGVFQWIDFLAAAGQQLWQVLPLNPTGYGDLPYQCLSVFAGNPRSRPWWREFRQDAIATRCALSKC
jgi:4-alpha-glucanotransferase